MRYYFLRTKPKPNPDVYLKAQTAELKQLTPHWQWLIYFAKSLSLLAKNFVNLFTNYLPSIIAEC